jgi:hypothetical protein
MLFTLFFSLLLVKAFYEPACIVFACVLLLEGFFRSLEHHYLWCHPPIYGLSVTSIRDVSVFLDERKCTINKPKRFNLHHAWKNECGLESWGCDQLWINTLDLTFPGHLCVVFVKSLFFLTEMHEWLSMLEVERPRDMASYHFIINW